MNKKKKLYNLQKNISENAIRIIYLLKCAVYKSGNERETVILGALALKAAEEIKRNSEKIGITLKHEQNCYADNI